MLDTAERLTGVYRGIVADRNDPEGLLRVRVRVTSLLGDQETDWAWPSVPALGGAQAPNVGDPIWIIFEEGDIDRPVYLGTWAPNQTPVAPVSTTPYIISGGTNVYAVTTAIAFATEITGDTSPRMTMTGDGTLRWGSGHAATDTAFGRTGVATLGLTGSLTVSSAVNAASLYASGALTAASATITGALTAASAAISGSLSAGATTLTGSLSGTSATFSSTLSAASLSLGSPLPISSGGTGSATQNFVDLTTAQTIGGVKSWTSPLREADGTATAPSYSFTSEIGLGLYRVAAGVLGLQVPGAGWISGRRPDGSEFFKVQQDGTIVGYNAASFNGLVTISAGGLAVQGSPSGYTDELRFSSTSNAAPGSGVGVGIASLMTGSPRMYFDHRATSNAGDWYWRNGTGGAVAQMSLTGGVLGVINGMSYIPVSLEATNARLWARGDYAGLGLADAAGNSRVLFGLRADIAGNTTDMVSYTYGGSIRFFPNGQETLRLNTDKSVWGGGTFGMNMFRNARSTQLTWETKDNADSGGAYWVAYADADAAVVGNDTWLLYGYPRNTSGGILGFEQILMFQFVNGKTSSYYKQGSVNVPYFGINAAPSTSYNLVVGGTQQISGQLFVQDSYAYIAQNTAAYALRLGEIYGDGGLYKAAGNMRFNIDDVAGSFFFSYQGSNKITIDHNGNITLNTGRLTLTGGRLIGGITIGSLSPGAGTTNIGITASSSWTSTTFTNMALSNGITDVSFTRTGSPNASLLIRISTSGWMSGAAGWVEIGVMINGGAPDYTICHFFFNDLGSHRMISGEQRLVLVGTGATTVRPRIRVSSGSTYQMDTDDTFSITVMEA